MWAVQQDSVRIIFGMDNMKTIRKRIMALRSSLTQLDVMRCSRAVIDRVFESTEYQNATAIYIYFETEKEISTHAIMKRAWKDGKRCTFVFYQAKVQRNPRNFRYFLRYQ